MNADKDREHRNPYLLLDEQGSIAEFNDETLKLLSSESFSAGDHVSELSCDLWERLSVELDKNRSDRSLVRGHFHYLVNGNCPFRVSWQRVRRERKGLYVIRFEPTCSSKSKEFCDVFERCRSIVEWQPQLICSFKPDSELIFVNAA
ncbi:MAG: hypothetical protein U5N86_07660 [Planctomycetota bacterium]|nr:hypothetical protein [Planctomycetota bacterium]